MSDCECTEEYGPCEDHGEVLVQREGAAVSTSDELVATLIEDVIDLAEAEGVGRDQVISHWGEDILAEAKEAIQQGDGWIPHEREGLIDSLYSLATRIEDNCGHGIFHDGDGYRIVRVTGGPLHDSTE